METGLPDDPSSTIFPVREAEEVPAPTPEPTFTVDPIREKVVAMTTEELAGQLLVAGIQGTGAGEDARQVIEDLHAASGGGNCSGTIS